MDSPLGSAVFSTFQRPEEPSIPSLDLPYLFTPGYPWVGICCVVHVQSKESPVRWRVTQTATEWHRGINGFKAKCTWCEVWVPAFPSRVALDKTPTPSGPPSNCAILLSRVPPPTVKI